MIHSFYKSTFDMTIHSVTALAHPNIAAIKYWGNRDDALRLPVNGSISINLDGLFTRTTISFQSSLPFDELIINGREIAGSALERVSLILDLVREMAGIKERAEIVSENNFPSGAGIASSASAFAALALDSSKAAGLDLSEREFRVWHGAAPARRRVPFRMDSSNGKWERAMKIHLHIPSHRANIGL